MTKFVSDITGRTARKEAAKTAKEHKEQIARQQQQEEAEAAQASADIAERRLNTKRKGRRSLISTSARGVQNLGGTQ